MIRILAALAFVMAMPAAAQSVYKCKDAKLGTVYQSAPCPEGHEQKRWSTETSGTLPASTPPVDETPRQAPETNAARTNRNANFGAELIGSMGRTPSAENCARARQVRDNALKDPSMNQDTDFIEAVKKSAADACR